MSDDPEEPKKEFENSKPKLSLVPNAKVNGTELPLRPRKFIPLMPGYTYGYKAGQNVVCRITKAEEGGYEVVIKKDNLPGFIKTIEQLKIGTEILAKFVCVYTRAAFC